MQHISVMRKGLSFRANLSTSTKASCLKLTLLCGKHNFVVGVSARRISIIEYFELYLSDRRANEIDGDSMLGKSRAGQKVEIV